MPPPDVTGQRAAPSPAAYWTYGQASPAPPMPRPPDLTVIGSEWAPSTLPDQAVQLGPTQIGYCDLYSSQDAQGRESRTLFGGTYAFLAGAMPRRA